MSDQICNIYRAKMATEYNGVILSNWEAVVLNIKNSLKKLLIYNLNNDSFFTILYNFYIYFRIFSYFLPPKKLKSSSLVFLSIVFLE